jgi:hypothetical protein
MQGPTDEASVPLTKSVMDSRILSGTMRRKIGIRTYPWLTAAAAAAEETPSLPPPLQLPPPEDEDLPTAKKPRLQAPSTTITSAAIRKDGAERVTTTDSPDDTPTVPVTHTPATSLPRAGTSHAPHRKWNEEEDTKLIEAVKKHGTAWVPVAALVPGRTNIQCRSRWTNRLNPDNEKSAGKWTPEEDTKLIEAVKKHGTGWTKIAALVHGRTNHQCRIRWTGTLDPAIGKIVGKWTPEEDTKLAEAVKKHGTDWVAVAAMVPGRTNDQCRARWVGSLDTAIMKIMGKWTPEEATNLTEAVKKHGTDWPAIAALVPGRTNSQCQQCWTTRLDPAIGKKAGKWTLEEDTKLIKAVKKHGTAWVAVAAMVPGRTNHQCRGRCITRLDPAIVGNNAGKWTP